MADSAPAQAQGTQAHGTQQSHAGRASSWLAVTVILLGFTIGGVALTIGPNWFLFWVGAGVVVVGGVLALVFDVFSDVIEDAPREADTQEKHPPFSSSSDHV
ncbi:hypothetical protein Sru01_03530 [Sphaerisporangium rufum]|uniref:Uncharacterized protein n=1 Tax=Sphaerisporangium rufum TaxID=1381558 RepID=A0A919UVT3_9ACTN|nr:HGxxPAAW family protein [Sphaerisporangium rufum]GII75371.1 hypothetical protein Sru01_03530 [Sphaerisporangium rufum]